MKIYQVGGAVRDELLGLPVKDRDFVVVGATPEEMTRLGFRPVGKDFPVFLHPQTHEEYALARTERKTARGYRGFHVYAAPDVTLEDDLRRRDLTINAMARDEQGQLIDPHGGERDLRAKILRHVSDAFAEDPVRILRIARFAARHSDFSIASETLALMQTMAANGEVDALVTERVWQELAKGLMEAKPSHMFEVLIEAHALDRIVPEFASLVPQHAALRKLDAAASGGAALAIRYATLVAAIDGRRRAPSAALEADAASAPVLAVSQRLRVPSDCADLAKLTLRWIASVEQWRTLAPEALLQLLVGADSLRRPERFRDLLQVCGYVIGPESAVQLNYLSDAQTALAAIDTKRVVAAAKSSADIPALVYASQLAAIKEFTNARRD
jgi:tRNA nucleotidyltransferase (CCA-adding enzyme)